MPTYEYQCPQGHEFERFQRMSDEPRAECPECGEEAERVLSGGAGFLFKGEGFYITDHRSQEYKKKATAEKEKREKKSSDGGEGGSKAESTGGSGSAGDTSSSGTASEDA